ncbi:MAG: hypothetical protein AAB425_11450, partial [Bdellovibrionota bacterium]
LTNLEGFPVVRVTLEGDPQSYVIANESFVFPETTGFRKYVARQHMEAGESAGFRGRPVTVLWRHAPFSSEAEKVVDQVGILEASARSRVIETQSIEEIPQLKKGWSRAKVREWLDATYKPATAKDAAIGVACGLMQIGMTACLTAAKIGLSDQLTMSGDFIHQMVAPSVLSMLFGGAIGTWNSTYRSIVYRGPDWWRTTKGMLLTSFPFAYSLMLWQGGVDPRALTVIENVGYDEAGKIVVTMGATGLFIHMRVMLNSVLNNVAKVGFQDINKMREQERVVSGTQANIESQVVSTIGPYMLKMTDLTDVAIRMGEVNVKIGSVAMLTSIPLVHYATLRYAEEQGYADAERLRTDWNERRDHPIWKFLYGPTEWAAIAAEKAGFRPANLVTRMGTFSAAVGNVIVKVGGALSAMAEATTSGYARLRGGAVQAYEKSCESLFLPNRE